MGRMKSAIRALFLATMLSVDVVPHASAQLAAPIKGRSLDHIGFEVKNLEAFCKNLEADGIKLDRPFTRLPNSTTAIASIRKCATASDQPTARSRRSTWFSSLGAKKYG